jgi:tight adherence protein C
MVVMLSCFFIFFIMFLSLAYFGRKRFAPVLSLDSYPSRLKQWLPIGWLILDKFKLMDRWSNWIILLQHDVILYYGRKNPLLYTTLYIAESITTSYIVFLIFSLLAILANYDWTIFIFGLCIAVLIPFLNIQQLKKKIRMKQFQMQIDLPELLNQIMLLVNAGETVIQAIIRCSESMSHKAHSPLYQELMQAVNELKVNTSLTKVMEDFNKRCALHEVSLFTTAILINYRKGGNDFILALQTLSHDLWQKRKAVARTLGEEASSKLVFPMVLIFAVVLVVIAAPAILLMNNQ